MKRISLQSLIMILLLFSISVPTAFAEKKEKGDANPYGLEIQAWTANGVTEVTVHAYAVDPAAAPPSGIHSLDLTAYDASDKKLFTQSYDSTEKLSIYETLKLQLDKKGRQVSKVHVEASIPVPRDTKKNPKTYTLEAAAPVKVRPDLTVINAAAPSVVNADEPFTVKVELKELSGQSGVTGRVDLLNGDQVLATYNEITVGPGKTVPAAFSAQLHEPGDYTLAVRIIKTDIAQSDFSNDLTYVKVHVEPSVSTLPIPMYNSQYFCSAASEHHVVKLRDGIFVEGEDVYSQSEAFVFDARVTGGILQGGSIAVELHGQTTGNTYSKNWSNLVYDGSQGPNYRLDDASQGFMLNLSDTPDGNSSVAININAGSLNGSYFYGGEWHPQSYAYGEIAVAETNALDYKVTITNNVGQTYVSTGTIKINYAPLQSDNYVDWENENMHMWSSNTNYQGQLSNY
ncbi:hypothetical protein PCCS19_38760 [Paenibacillus sp. CCS19]|uniref:hypothetical protein n=1 Tax=Paenibacillus sp. CCS19 TaxID=3158387 RepID=UPI002569196E|nr:hypothetical protein [Paenibacillus cellulosilyticus]GMK40820.1 hypothetical protein PCCS19_38760 [Paenibacillus cellulosilyticus]